MKHSKLKDGQEWVIYIPEEGDWPINHKLNASYSEARETYLKWADRKRLPKNSFIHIVDI